MRIPQSEPISQSSPIIADSAPTYFIDGEKDQDIKEGHFDETFLLKKKQSFLQ